jgi:predicted AAA+ superfamily ATPase
MFVLDIGLLRAMANLDSTVIVEGNRVFEEFKGAVAEQYVCQQLVSDVGLQPFYWSAQKSSGKIDFIYQHKDTVVPLEVKAEVNLKSKSLATFCKTYGLDNAIRLSMADYQQQGWLTNIPLYAVSCLP